MKTNPKAISPVIGIIMGSASDAETMEPARKMLNEFGVPCEFKVISAHRTPDEAFKYAEQAYGRGLKVIIAGAGGAAHLAGVIAAKTAIPVIGVPIKSKTLNGLDSLLSMVQMPSGIPVATVAIDGAANAALLALRILGVIDKDLYARMIQYQGQLRDQVLREKV
jgi:phosphoribosylaminoimidazole carboxylase PurE protein